jgi:hypothetical protein
MLLLLLCVFYINLLKLREEDRIEPRHFFIPTRYNLFELFPLLGLNIKNFISHFNGTARDFIDEL